MSATHFSHAGLYNSDARLLLGRLRQACSNVYLFSHIFHSLASVRRLLVVESRSLPSAAHIYHHVGDAFQSRRPSRQRRTAAVRAFAGMPRRSACRSCVVVCSARRCTSCVLDLLQDFRSPRRSNTVATVPVYGYGGRAVPSWGPVYRTPIEVCRVRGLVDHGGNVTRPSVPAHS